MSAADEVRRLAARHGIDVTPPPGDHGLNSDPVIWGIGTLWDAGILSREAA